MKISNKFIMISAIFALFLFGLSYCSADSQFSKLGTQFSSASGGYASSPSQCSDICSWITGSEVLVGASNSYSPNWGGSMTWNFDLSSINLNGIDRAEVVLSWPNYLGKGLHSPLSTAQGFIQVNGNEILRLTTNKANTGFSDYYNPSGMVFSITQSFSSSFLSSSTNILVGTDKALWDIGEVKLYLYTANKTVKIVNGKFSVKGIDFLIKGIDYAPWIQGSGPDPTTYLPFPNEMDDVTSKMTSAGKISVKDYNADGKIQMGEVIQYDLETMKSMGVNTIRTYASGGWHDRNMNNIIDSGEVSQGDMPGWMIDKILAFANANNMKVIIGYWVQEENYAGSIPYVCDSNDLAVAEKTFGNIVNKYKNNTAVLGWGIGNEVKLGENHVWFSWGMDSNLYINQLNDYVRTLDYNHPIIYAKYVGEAVNFNNINSDVISINSFTNTAQDLINAGEFSITAPSGKAYMLGEFGHNIADADGQWNLAKQYAGGCFLEYNDMGWKVNAFYGTVNEYREKKLDRFNKVVNLYLGGNIACTANSDCGSDSLISGTEVCNVSNNNQILANYKVYSCNNPGTTTSSCTSSTLLKFKASCSSGQFCSSGVCRGVTCNTNSNCGVDSWVAGADSCNITNSKQILGNYLTYTCNNPGTSISSCVNNTILKLKSNCSSNQSCSAGVCRSVTCNTNSDCGADNLVNGTNVCSSLNAKQIFSSYKTYTCNNPGTITSSCSNTTTLKPKTNCSSNQLCDLGICKTVKCASAFDCGINVYSGNYFCSSLNNRQVVQNYTNYNCNNPGTVNSFCSVNITQKLWFTCAVNQACDSLGICRTFTCSNNTQCGTDKFMGNLVCSGKDIKDTWRAYTCNNPGTIASSCSYNDTLKLTQTCPNFCSNGSCTTVNNIFFESFNNLSGITTNRGTLFGSVSFVSNKCGNSVNLSNGAYVRYPLSGNFPSNPEFSIEFWMKPGTKSAYGLFTIGPLSGTPNSIGIFSNYNLTYLEILNNASQWAQIASSRLVSNSWNHVAVTFTKNNTVGCYVAKLYLNSLAQSSTTICNLNINMSSNMDVGSATGSYGPSYSYMDEFRISNSSISAADITIDYQRMKSCLV